MIFLFSLNTYLVYHQLFTLKLNACCCAAPLVSILIATWFQVSYPVQGILSIYALIQVIFWRS